METGKKKNNGIKWVIGIVAGLLLIYVAKKKGWIGAKPVDTEKSATADELTEEAVAEEAGTGGGGGGGGYAPPVAEDLGGDLGGGDLGGGDLGGGFGDDLGKGDLDVVIINPIDNRIPSNDLTQSVDLTITAKPAPATEMVNFGTRIPPVEAKPKPAATTSTNTFTAANSVKPTLNTASVVSEAKNPAPTTSVIETKTKSAYTVNPTTFREKRISGSVRRNTNTRTKNVFGLNEMRSDGSMDDLN